MRGLRILFLSGSLALLLPWSAPPARAAWPHDPAVNVPLCAAVGNQSAPAIAPDGGAPGGTGSGAIVTWSDHRSGSDYDIYAQRVDAAGVAQWMADGVALCTMAGDQSNPTIVADGSGGAIVTWQDYRSGSHYDIYAQRVDAAGVAQWKAGGVALCTAA